jgi:phosphatidylcholine synthase
MPDTRARLVAAFTVHLLTASGAAIAFGALIAAIQGEFTVMFALLGLALLIDGVDGALARRLRVAELLPRWSGETLDHVVDYLTYVFVPAYALASGAILPQSFAIPAAVAILISGAIYFADKRMKTDDGYFLGFPALWNLVAIYLFIVQPAAYVALAVVAILEAITYGPIAFIHPLRAKNWPAVNLILLVVWAAFGGVALAYHLVPPPAYVIGLLVVGLYFAVVGFVRPATRGA